MKKYWYTSLLAFSLLISAIASTLPASVYGIVTSVFVRVCSNGQETTENIDAELSAGKYDRPETSQAENKRPQDPAIHGTAPVVPKHSAHKNDSSESVSMEASSSDSIDATPGPATSAPQTPAATSVGRPVHRRLQDCGAFRIWRFRKSRDFYQLRDECVQPV